MSWPGKYENVIQSQALTTDVCAPPASKAVCWYISTAVTNETARQPTVIYAGSLLRTRKTAQSVTSTTLKSGMNGTSSAQSGSEPVTAPSAPPAACAASCGSLIASG